MFEADMFEIDFMRTITLNELDRYNTSKYNTSMNYKSKSDGLTEAIEKLRAELGTIKEELRIIDLRKPALESRAKRISEALSMLMGDGSTGDPRWMQLPRITEGGLDHSDEQPFAYGLPHETRKRTPKVKPGPSKKPEITEDALIAMSYYMQKVGHPVKSSELYEHLVANGHMEPIETEMPYKSFAITLRNIQQDFIEYSRNSKTWTTKDLSPKAKLREALEKADGTRVISSQSQPVSREDHPFVKVLTSIFDDNHWDTQNATRIYDELSERREFGMIPGVGSFADFTATVASYKDFFPLDEKTGLYQCVKHEPPTLAPATKQEAFLPKQDVMSGVQGLYTVKQNGGVPA